MHELPVSDVSFEHVLNIVKDIYDVIWTSGFLIWDFLSQPVNDDLVEFLPALAGLNNFELIFGSGLLIALTYSLVKFFTPL